MEQLVGLVSTNYNSDKFGKLTSHRPIAAIPFGSRYRLIDFALSNMVNSGIISVGLITPHLYRSIMDHIGSGKEFGLSRKHGGLFILPGSTYGYDIGTGKFSMRDLKGNVQYFTRREFQRVACSACDKIFNIDYKDVEKQHVATESNITLVYKKVAQANPGEYVVDLDDYGKVKTFRRLKKVEKDANLFIDTMIADREIILAFIDWYKDNSHVDLYDIIGENLGHLFVTGYEFNGYVKSINSITDYMEASKDLLCDDVIKELFMSGRPIHTKVHDAAPVKYFDTATVKKTMVGTGSLVKGSVENSIVFRNTVISEGAKIKNSVIMQKTRIGKKVILENVICEKNVVIGDGEVYKGTENKPIIISND